MATGESQVRTRMAGGVDFRSILTLEPGKRGGKPCIRGIRITVFDVFSYLASGMTEAEILEEHPELTTEDILACYGYAVAMGENITVLAGL